MSDLWIVGSGTAVLILLAGFLTAKLLQKLVVKALAKADATIGKHANSEDDGRWFRLPPSAIVGRMVFWTVLLLFASVGADALGLRVVSTWTASLATYAPRIIAAAVVICVGIVIGGLARDAAEQMVRNAGAAYGRVLGRTLQLGVVGIAIVIAAEQLGINVTFLAVITAIVCGSLLIGAALAFALGARTTVSNILASHYLRQSCAIGETVRIEGHEGRVLAIDATSVTLEAGEQRIMIPAKLFSQRIAVTTPLPDNTDNKHE